MLKLPEFCRALNERMMIRVSYARVLAAVFSGAINAEQHHGRWYLSPDAIPAAVEMFTASKGRAA